VSGPPWSLGSRWLRWDPHLHAPGTLRNDQFGGDWDGYLSAIEQARPAPIALGVTDYFTLRGYKEVLRRRRAGALPSVELLFPNIELRLTIETKDRQGINLHLLVCPNDSDHVRRVEEKLSQLRFRYRDDFFPCTDEALIRLGRAHRGDASLADHNALQEGANQFKVELSDVRKLFDEDAWVRANVIVAVAAGNDGLAGIARDAAFRAQREELGRFAHAVFSGNPQDHAYWLGKHPDFAANGQTPKPCLHGSDAHALSTVLRPHGDRRCWVRAEPTFDGLRQTLVEPERRVHIGEAPPQGPRAGSAIRVIRLKNAPWVDNQELHLNDGLVTIIGAKGSGKTALADLVAFAADAAELEPGPASFTAKAGELLDGLCVELEWGDGVGQRATFSDDRDPGEPRVRYLSQQFVERLCTPGGLSEPLVEEIERVVFSAIAEEDRLQCSSFSELRAVMLEGSTAERDSERESIKANTKLVADETKLLRSIASLRGKVLEAERERKGLETELAAIPVMVSNEKVAAHKAAGEKLRQLKEAIAAEERRAQQIGDVAAEVQRQLRSAASAVGVLRARHEALLDPVTWDLLTPRLHEDASSTLTRLQRAATERAAALRARGTPTLESGMTGGAAPMGLVALVAEEERTAKELGLDQANAKRRVDIEKRLTASRTNETKARTELAHAERAPIRIKDAQAARLGHYLNVFRSLVAEEHALEQLYAPLRRRVAEDERLLRLAVVVHRVVDVTAWANRGESLLDLRKPPFNRRGALAEIARAELLKAWTRGSAEEVRAAMQAFLEKHASDAMDNLAQGSTPLDLGEWLFSTDHISVRYSIQYEGVEIAHLSPGTRGVVLLTLYLALDEWDERPLVIDQPEENLDPRSVYADLVPFFREAARRRQIIMVTHNANLVVNSDSDQVIVAEARRTSPTSLPQVRYTAGGLENAEIRTHVCRLLEGGEDAFRKRGQRYGVPPG